MPERTFKFEEMLNFLVEFSPYEVCSDYKQYPFEKK